MDYYVEDLSYYKNFWNKSGLLLYHFSDKFSEFQSLGNIFKRLANLSGEFSENILKAKQIANNLDISKANKKKKNIEKIEQENFYIPLQNQDNSTRSVGIKALFNYFDRLSKSFNYLKDAFMKISNDIMDKKNAKDTILIHGKYSEERLNNYKNALDKLSKKRESYCDSINKAIEFHLSHLKKNSKKNDKHKEEIRKKGNEYLSEIKLTEEKRVEYIVQYGHYLSSMEEFEKNFTNDLKLYLKNFAKNITTFQKEIEFNESELKQIEEMNGDKDNQIFVKNNKSLMNGPKRILFKQYIQNMNYYMENFQFLKKEIKNKSPNELKIFQDNISEEVKKFLNEIIFKETDDIKDKIIDIAKNLNENKLSEDEFNYLINKFEERFLQQLDWKSKNNIDKQNFKKVGPQYDDRYSYADTFLEYFKQLEEENKSFEEENFNYFCKIIEKILELNMNDDIDYDLCHLIMILSSKFYMVDNSKKLGKKFAYETIRNFPIMKKQGFWLGFTIFEIKQEITQKLIFRDDNITEDMLKDIINTKLVNVIFDIMKLMNDSQEFNKIIYDIFKYYKIDKENIIFLLNKVELNASNEDINHIIIDKNLIFSDS